MEQTTIKIIGTRGRTFETLAFCFGDLAVHQIGKLWRITHTPTSYDVTNRGLLTKKNAIDIARKLNKEIDDATWDFLVAITNKYYAKREATDEEKVNRHIVALAILGLIRPHIKAIVEYDIFDELAVQ